MSGSQNVTITSPFRDCEGDFIERYIDQVNSLDFPRDQLRFVLVEGDSTDGTYQQLDEWREADERVTLIKFDTNRDRYPSIVDRNRFAHLSEIFNTGIGSANRDWSTHVLFIPSDVMYNPELLTGLLKWDKNVIAPMFWHLAGAGLVFYDVWGFTRNGQHFKPWTTTHYEEKLPREPIKMDTVGGAILSKIEVINAGVRYTAQDVDHGYCYEAQRLGFDVWCDPTSHIVHEQKV